jgi:hypothetical protein
VKVKDEAEEKKLPPPRITSHACIGEASQRKHGDGIAYTHTHTCTTHARQGIHWKLGHL